MVRFLKVVENVDMLTDIIPVVSTFKNIGILLYQRSHKVHHVANPKTDYKDDIKIHLLSKPRAECFTALVPFFGNLAVLIKNAINSVKFHLLAIPHTKLGFFSKTVLEENPHQIEILSLYLARYPFLSEKKIASRLLASINANRLKITQVILNRYEFSSETLGDALIKMSVLRNSTETAQLILNKSNSISDEQIARALKNAVTFGNDSLVKILLEYRPSLDQKHIQECVIDRINQCTLEIFSLLLDKITTLPKDSEVHILRSLTKRPVEFIAEFLKNFKEIPSNCFVEPLTDACFDNAVIFEYILNTQELDPHYVQIVLNEAVELSKQWNKESIPLSIEIIKKKFPELKAQERVED